MRGIGLLAAMIVLTSCGDRSGTNGDQPAGDPGQANQPKEAEPAAQAANSQVASANDSDPEIANPCLVQGSDRLEVRPIRAVGTEPFWSARVEGRCVTYSTPEDQQGTRVWTRYAPAPNGGGTWTGSLGGKSFEMRTRAEAGCSDGMSDKSYPMAVELTVHGEQRRGCAEPFDATKNP